MVYLRCAKPSIFAALATGNTIVAQPAVKTPIVACYAIALLQQAGVPSQVLQLLKALVLLLVHN